MRFAFLVFALSLGVAAAQTEDLTRFGFITAKGYVLYSVPSDWRVLTVQTKGATKAAAYQIANPADEGTPDSTNVLVTLYDLSDERGRAATAVIGKAYGSGGVEKSSDGEWTLYSQTASQNGTAYILIDATRSVADVMVGIRCAWPHLPRNPEGYDSHIRALCESLWRSVDGHLGRDIPPGLKVFRKKE